MLKSILRELREQKGLPQSKIAEILGVSPAAYSTYEMGTRDVSSDKIVTLAKFYGVTTDYLYGIEDNSQSEISFDEQKHIKKYRVLDEHGKKVVDFILNEEYIRCTYAEETENESDDFISLSYSLLRASAVVGDWLDEEQFDKIKVKDTPEARKADMVIEVDGHSMEPDYCDGDKVLVRLQPDIYVGEVGIFILNGMGYIKKLGENELISINPEYDNVPIDEYNECRCVGKVVGIAEE